MQIEKDFLGNPTLIHALYINSTNETKKKLFQLPVGIGRLEVGGNRGCGVIGYGGRIPGAFL